MFKGLFAAATGFLGGIQTYLIVGAVCVAVGAAGSWRVMSWREGAHANAESKAVVRLVRLQSAINVKLGTLTIKQLNFAAGETARRQQEIPQHVTPEIDRAYPVPLGFVRMFNDASHGPIPGPAAGRDSDPSGVPISDVAHAHAADEGTLDQCRVDLGTWWSWYDQHSAAWNKATGN